MISFTTKNSTIAMNALLGSVVNNGESYCHYWVKSFRMHNKKDDLVIFTNTPEKFSTPFVEHFKITLQKVYLPKGGALINSRARFWPYIKKLVQYSPQCMANIIVKQFISFMSLRFYWYRDYLLASGQKYNKIVLSDTRDVFFQGDIFEFGDYPSLGFFQEVEGRLLGNCSMNSEWVDKQIDPSQGKLLKNHEIICAGVIVGSLERILDFLTAYELKVLASPAQIPNGDQAIVNLLARTTYADKSIIYTNYDPFVLTVCNDSKSWIIDEGIVKNSNKTPYLCIHQYDRESALVDLACRNF